MSSNLRVLFIRRAARETDFVEEQAQALREHGVEVDFFYLHGSGSRVYCAGYRQLRRLLKEGRYDLAHAHYGLSGLLCGMQRIRPTVVTFMGSDVNELRLIRPLSRIAYHLSAHSIFVEDSLRRRLNARRKTAIIPYGINLSELTLLDKAECRRELGLDAQAPLVLFASSSDRPEKNYGLARAAVERLPDASLIELGGYTRPQFIRLLNAVDVLLMTSLSEGSPVTITEAMACNCPIVSTDVGDVRDKIEGVQGCYLTSYDPDDVVDKLKLALDHKGRTDGRTRVAHWDNGLVADRILDVYRAVLREPGPSLA